MSDGGYSLQALYSSTERWVHTKSGTKNRDGYDVYLIDYSADVYVMIPNSDQNNPDLALLASNDTDTIAQYSGIYSSTIYYHVIYDDGQSQ